MTATLDQVRVVAEYAEYAARTAYAGLMPRSFEAWLKANYGCPLELVGTQ